MTTPILYDSHMHTPLCKHAKGEPEAYAEQAEKIGLKGIFITCHNPGPKGWGERVRMTMAQFPTYLEMVERAQAEWNGRIDIRLGLESDYYPGFEPFLQELHQKADFQYILGSIHPSHPYYREKFYKGNAIEHHQLYFEHLAMAAESQLFDCLSHPDLVKNDFPHQYNLDKLMDHIKHNLDRIAKTGIAMELNTSGLHKRVKEMNPAPEILAEMYSRDIPVVLGSDSHSPDRVGADFIQAMDMLDDAGYEELTYFTNRQPTHISLKSAYESLLVKTAVHAI